MPLPRRARPLLAAALLAGCAGPPTAGRTDRPRATPSYNELATRFNANAGAIDRLWGRALVIVRWRDDRGRGRSEQGDDSKLLYARPDRFSLGIGAAGHTVFMVGSNESRYWAFDLGGDGTAWVGRHSEFARHSPGELPLPLNPLQLPRLLGLLPLDPAATGPDGRAPEVRWEGDALLIEPPGTRSRMLVDPERALPLRVELLDDAGRAVAISRLRAPGAVRVAGAPEAIRPLLMRDVTVTLPERDASVTIQFRDVTEAEGPDEADKAEAFARVFDFDRLRRAFNPERVVDLDAAPPADGARAASMPDDRP